MDVRPRREQRDHYLRVTVVQSLHGVVRSVQSLHGVIIKISQIYKRCDEKKHPNLKSGCESFFITPFAHFADWRLEVRVQGSSFRV